MNMLPGAGRVGRPCQAKTAVVFGAPGRNRDNLVGLIYFFKFFFGVLFVGIVRKLIGVIGVG